MYVCMYVYIYICYSRYSLTSLTQATIYIILNIYNMYTPTPIDTHTHKYTHTHSHVGRSMARGMLMIGARKKNRKILQQKKNREEYGPGDVDDRCADKERLLKVDEAHWERFAGNNEDHFRIGLQMHSKYARLYAPFYTAICALNSTRQFVPQNSSTKKKIGTRDSMRHSTRQTS